MRRLTFHQLFGQVLADRQLLHHPFYRRWEAGDLAVAEVAAYAEQYRHLEQVLPDVLERIIPSINQAEARKLVTATLNDERGMPMPHVDLFDEFAAAVGARADTSPTSATAELVDLYWRLVETGPVEALAGIGAYEVQASGIAASKSVGLRTHYGLGCDQTRFWDVHASLEDQHSAWTLCALAAITNDAIRVRRAARASADAWWRFLDEREAAAESDGGLGLARRPT